MNYNMIIVEPDDEYIVITLNRPRKLNAINHELLAELGAAMDEINEMPEVKAVLIKGAGRAFSSGTDLQALGNDSQDRGRTGYRYHLGRLQDTFGRIERLEKPVIAQIHGYAFGGALELALACDFRIAAEDAKMGLLEVLYGIIPDLGGCQRLTRVVGLPRAKELVMTGRSITGLEAERIALVNKAVPSASLEREVQKWVNTFIALPPLPVGLGKRMVDKSMDMDIISSLDVTAQVQSMLLGTTDFQEAITAKLEKRQPVFKGK